MINIRQAVILAQIHETVWKAVKTMEKRSLIELSDNFYHSIPQKRKGWIFPFQEFLGECLPYY